MLNIAIYAFTQKGLATAQQLQTHFSGQLFCTRRLDETHGFDSIHTLVASTFTQFEGHVFVGAAGIAVRAIAPHIQGKTIDPAVVVVDQDGAFSISLLAGHIGGANELAREVAGVLNATAVITTATDVQNVPAIDELARQKGLAIANPQRIKDVSAALLEEKTVCVSDPDHWLGPLPEQYFVEDGTPDVIVTHEQYTAQNALVLHPPSLVAGMGSRKNAPAEDILSLLSDTCKQYGLAMSAMGAIASIDAKAEEPGLQIAAQTLGVPFVTYPADVLDRVDVPSPSCNVQKHMGVDGVCEAAAMVHAQASDLLVQKCKNAKATLAIAIQKPKN